jgi:hypothetical protein
LCRSGPEDYILQTLFGILPNELWLYHEAEGKKPFDGYSESDKRVAKRKFRKLKKKAGVKVYDSSRTLWNKINLYLAKRAEDTSL